MSLTPTQRATVLTAINGDATALAFKQAGDAFSLKLWLNAATATNVWRTEAPVTAIIDSIVWANYTPNDLADNTATFTNRALLAQTKQMNLQLMLQGRTTLDCSKVNIRAGLRDSVIQLPTGVGGAMTSPGGASGATTLANCIRVALKVEQILASAPQTTGSTTASILTFEGQADDSDAGFFVNN